MTDYPLSEIVDMISIVSVCRNNSKAAERLYAHKYSHRRYLTGNDKAIIAMKRLIERARKDDLKKKRHKTGSNELKPMVTLDFVAVHLHTFTRKIQQ